MMKRRAFIVLVALSLLVTTTYCWILERSEAHGTALEIPYYQVKVADDNTLSLLIKQYDNNGVPQALANNQKLQASGLVPGESVRFQILISNAGNESKSVRIVLSNISCVASNGIIDNSMDILKYLYLIVSPGDGYVNSGNPDVVIPETIIVKLSDIMVNTENSNIAVIFSSDTNELIVPTTEVGQYSTLECRLWFDSNAEAFENVTINIGRFIIGL